MGAQLAIRFVNVEAEGFGARLPTVLPLVRAKMLLLGNEGGEGRFVKIALEQGDKTDEDKQTERDHSLIQMLNLVEKTLIHCPLSMKDPKYFDDYDDIAQQCKALLAHPHAWVRLRATKVLGHVVSVVAPEELDALLSGKTESDRGFVYCDPEESLKSLLLDLCAQYTPNISKEMADLVSRYFSLLLSH